MSFSTRSKVSIILSAVTILTLVSAFMVTIVSRGTASHAASTPPTTASYQGTTIKSHVLATSKNFLSSGSSATATAQQKDPRYIPYRSPGKQNSSGPNALARGAPRASGSALSATEGALASNFDGLSDTQNKAVAGFHDTPPDQGLCVGFLPTPGSTKVVIEVVNSIFGIYTTGGTLLKSFTLTTGFMDPNAFSDPRCFYDTSTHSFYMTVISCFSCFGPNDSVDDVLVVDGITGFATTYQFDTSVGGTCFGDQPHTGYDSHALYVATDEFCGPGDNTYSGALLIGISKSQLAAQGPTPNAVSFPLLSLGGVPILTLQPAFGNNSSKEYLLNSFPFDQFGNSNSIANTLGFWAVQGDANITTGSGPVTLNGRIIGSETYAFPMPAASTGNGTTPSGSPAFVISEPFLQPDDSRMQQVQAVNNSGDIDLYASLPTALNIPGDPSARDGVAWFKIDAESHTFEAQGYVAVAGAYLLYPAILHTRGGTTTMAFTITSPTINPSAAYTVMPSTSTSFGAIKIAAAGTGPHVSFSDILFGRARWGDYSAEELDPNGLDIWSATEYIGPPPGGTDTIDNWGTRIWDVTGNH